MTQEQSLRNAILADGPETDEAQDDRAARRAERQQQIAGSFARRMVIRLVVLGLSLGMSAMMLYTEQGRELRGQFQSAVLATMKTGFEARYAAAPAAGEEAAPVARVQPEPAAAPASDGPRWLAAFKSEPEPADAEPVYGPKAKVSAMPESRTSVLRAGK